MYDLVRKEIYEKFLANKEKKTAILWSGGPYSSLLWFVAYNDLNLRLPIIFVDTGDLPPALYAHVTKLRKDYKLDLTIISGKVEDVIKNNKDFEVLYTGKAVEGGTCIIPNSPETWNYLKSLAMPFFKGVKRLM
jgi:3'-phosphoadenosine 5'-phosphosulfate sulfotransferase (PAPS reductase)/FAD synthetase